MLARHRLLAARGWAVISVPYYVWDAAGRCWARRVADAGALAMHCSMLAASLMVIACAAPSARARMR